MAGQILKPRRRPRVAPRRPNWLLRGIGSPRIGSSGNGSVLHRRKEIAGNESSGTAEAVPVRDIAMQRLVTRLDHEVRSAIRVFAFRLAIGTLDREILAGLDYRLDLARSSSGMEMAFAIFTNVLTIYEDRHVTNPSEAQSRAAQWIRAYCSPGYHIEPPLQDWEIELI